MKISIFIFLSIILIASSAKNYASNPSFEKLGGMVGAEGWYADNWGGCYVTSTIAHTGQYSMHGSKPGDHFWQIRYDLFYGIKYKFTAWIKVKNIKNARLLATVEASDYKSGLYVYHDSIPKCATGTCDDQWYQLSYNSLMNFKKASHYVISISLRATGSDATGEFWMDDITVEPLEYDILNGVEVVTWKQEVYEDPIDVIVSLNIIDSVFVNGDYLNLKVYIEDQETNEVKQILDNCTYDNVFEDIRVARFKWNPKSLPKDRFCVVKAKLINELFSNRTETKYTTVKKLKEKINYSFYVDKYLIAWDNGKKFFPMGLYFQTPNKEDVENLKNSPFNLIKAPGFSPEVVESVYADTNNQVRVINNLGVNIYYQATKENLEKVRNNTKAMIDKYKNVKGFFGFYIFDEPPIHDGLIRNLREATLTVREFSPNHITWAAINSYSGLDRFKEAVDVVGIPCYPLQYYEELADINSMSSVGRRLMINNKPQWDIPQIFDWELYNKNTNEKPPTEKQLKNMVYQWIGGGAMGLIFYDYHEMKKMNHKNPFAQEWQKVLNVVNELKDKYVNIILSRTKINPNYNIPKFDGIGGSNLFSRRQFRYKGYDYLLIVNHRDVVNNDVYFYKPSTTTTLENYGNNDENVQMTIDEKTNKVSLKMPRASYIWIKGYDTQWNPPEDNDEPDWNGEDNDSNSSLAIILISVGSVLVICLTAFLIYWFVIRKKNDDLEDKVTKFNENEEENKFSNFFKNTWNKFIKCITCKKNE